MLRGLGHRIDEKDMDVPASAALAVFAHWFAGTSIDAETLAAPSRMRTHARWGRWVRKLGLVRPACASASGRSCCTASPGTTRC